MAGTNADVGSFGIRTGILAVRGGFSSDRFNPNGKTEVLAVERWLFTSAFLMRLIEAPVVLLRT